MMMQFPSFSYHAHSRSTSQSELLSSYQPSISSSSIKAILFVLWMLLSSSCVYAANEQILADTRLFPNNVENDDRYANAVSIYEDTAIVGAEGDDTYTGSAYIFQRQANESWILIQKLTASDKSIFSWFGQSVSIYGDAAIVGADHVGAAYIFEKQMDGEWTETQRLTASDAMDGDDFGYAVRIYQDTAVVGAPYANDSGSGSGAVYVFQRQNVSGNWTQVQKFTASDASKGDRFGHALDIYNQTLIVCAAERNQTYIFERDIDGTWTEISALISPVSTNYYFNRVSVHEDTFIVGADWDSTKAGDRTGAVYVYEKVNNTQWTYIHTLYASDAAHRDEFGSSVSVYNETMVIGADKDSNWRGIEAGTVYIFRKSASGKWIEDGVILAADGDDYSLFGHTVCIYNDYVVIGAVGHDSIGAAYIADLQLTNTAINALNSFAIVAVISNCYMFMF